MMKKVFISFFVVLFFGSIIIGRNNITLYSGIRLSDLIKTAEASCESNIETREGNCVDFITLPCLNPMMPGLEYGFCEWTGNEDDMCGYDDEFDDC